ncbi:MAG: hypothetical protein AAF151_10945 [Cyanobacteria bacterium J06656_5]
MMGASDQSNNQSSDEVVRKPVVPPGDGVTEQDELDDTRSPTDEETTRDSPEQSNNQSSDEVVRKLVVPPSEDESEQDDPDDDRSPTDEETTRDIPK